MFSHSIILFQLVAGLYTAPVVDTQQTVIVKNSKGISVSTTIKAVSDTAVDLLVFGACVDANPIYKKVQQCTSFSMGPRAGKGGSIGPWVDTLRFNRIYQGEVPTYLIKSTDTTYKNMGWGDTTLLTSYYSPNITFIIRSPDVLEFAKDSNHAIFRVLRDDAQEVFVIAKYANKLDSLRIVTVPNGWCGKWPDCYYNPIKIVMPELPRIYLDDMVRESRGLIPVPYRKPPDD